MTVFYCATTVDHKSAYTAGGKVGGCNVSIVGAVLYSAHIERGYGANVVVACYVIVLVEDDVLNDTVLVDTTKQGVVLACCIVAALGVVDAADGMAVAVESAVETIGYLGNLGVAVLAYGRQLNGVVCRTTEVDVVSHLEVLAGSFVVGIAVLGHCCEIGRCADDVRVALCTRTFKSPAVRYCRVIALCHNCHRCYASEDECKDFLHILIFKVVFRMLPLP